MPPSVVLLSLLSLGYQGQNRFPSSTISWVPEYLTQMVRSVGIPVIVTEITFNQVICGSLYFSQMLA